ncbi:MAG: hypothetical protein H0W33_05020 [Gammaproteobacteria bacterium]|nr:hypothetical protein [Gammaproteobacteria bacterium]
MNLPTAPGEVIAFPDGETCTRCGASMQATHHPLCEARDGTPTDLSDAEVRQLIWRRHGVRVLRLGGGTPDEAAKREPRA